MKDVENEAWQREVKEQRSPFGFSNLYAPLTFFVFIVFFVVAQHLK